METDIGEDEYEKDNNINYNNYGINWNRVCGWILYESNNG